jgi:hypothetical protein
MQRSILYASLMLAIFSTLPGMAVAKSSVPGLSDRRVSANNTYVAPPCIDGMTKNANISVSFNSQEKSLADARGAFDRQKKEMETEMQKIGAGQVKLNSYNYSISVNSNYNNGIPSLSYNFSGNLNYEVGSEEIAVKLSNRLAELKRQFNLNLNANRCQNAQGA